MSYNFGNLSNIDFEHLCKDLLEKTIGLPLENFSSGQDGGIDLRHAYKNKNTIIQCKHYLKSGYQGLKGTLKKEKVKLLKLNLDRYILITSASLSPLNKKEIMKILDPYIKESGDIYGIEEVIALIRKNPEVEKAHLKLWLSSSAVLEKLLSDNINNKINKQSEFEIKAALELSKIYVQNSSFKKSLERLLDDNLVIISGEPGVGKTLLAKMLYLYFIEKSYEFINVTSDIKDAISMINEDKKQIFYFDDFLGQTNLIEKGEVENYSEIMLIINQIRATGKKFIFTTREYILQGALDVNETLSRDEKKIEILKYTLNLSSYTKRDKTLILYNHLLYNDVKAEYIENLVEGKKYKKIIEHKNYNPRLIEYFTKEIDNSNENFSYYEYILNILENPTELWESPFYKLSEAGKSIVLCIWMNSNNYSISLENLEIFFWDFHLKRSKKYNFKTTERDFKIGLKETEGSFTLSKVNNSIGFRNPSIIDFLNGHIKDCSDYISVIIKMDLSISQLHKIHTYITQNNYGSSLDLLLDEVLLKYNKDKEEINYIKLSRVFLSVYPNLENDQLKKKILDFYLTYPETDPTDSYYIMNTYNEALDDNIFPNDFLKKLLELVFNDIKKQEPMWANISRYKEAYEISRILNKLYSETLSFIEKGISGAIEDAIYEIDLEGAKEIIEFIDNLDDIPIKVDKDERDNIDFFIEVNTQDFEDYDDDWRRNSSSDSNSNADYGYIIESLLN